MALRPMAKKLKHLMMVQYIINITAFQAAQRI